MPGCKLVHREGRSDPKNVNRTVDMRAVPERHGDACQTVVLWRIAVSSANETRVADSVPAPTRLAEDPRRLQAESQNPLAPRASSTHDPGCVKTYTDGKCLESL